MRTMLLTAALTAFALGAQAAPAKTEKPAAATRVPVGGVRAASVAAADFEAHLRELKVDDDLRPWMKAMAVVENYDAEIVRDGAAWVVRFRPTVTSLLDGSPVKGGGGEYRVDPSSYRIIDRTFWK